MPERRKRARKSEETAQHHRKTRQKTPKTDHGIADGVLIRASLEAFSHVDTITLDAGENELRSGFIDAQNGYVYFGTISSPAKIVQVGLGD